METTAYDTAKATVVAALVNFLTEGEKIGKSQMQVQADFIAAFSEAAQEAQAA